MEGRTPAGAGDNGGHSGGNGGAGGLDGAARAAEAVASLGAPARGGEEGSLLAIVTAQRDRFRQR